VDHRKINPTGKDVYELFAELESINPELADLYKDVALYSYGVQIEEGLTEVKRWQAVAALVVLLSGLLGINNRLAQKAYDSSHQMQQLIQVYSVAEERGDTAKMADVARRIKNHQVRLDIGKGDVDFDGRPGDDDIKDLDYLNPIGNKGGADFNWPGNPNPDANEARRPTTSSTHSTTKDIKKHDPAHGHTHPEGGNPKVCPKCKGAGCAVCGDTGEVISKLRNDPKVESLKWTPGSDKKSWWDK
jgi:hypothetical protein